MPSVKGLLKNTDNACCCFSLSSLLCLAFRFLSGLIHSYIHPPVRKKNISHRSRNDFLFLSAFRFTQQVSAVNEGRTGALNAWCYYFILIMCRGTLNKHVARHPGADIPLCYCDVGGNGVCSYRSRVSYYCKDKKKQIIDPNHDLFFFYVIIKNGWREAERKLCPLLKS